MADELVMPRLSDTMERGTIARWVVKEGDAFQNGDVLAEIETDKALMELSAYDDGVLLKILVPDGAEAELGAPIAVTGEAGEEVPAEMLLAAPVAAPVEDATSAGEASAATAAAPATRVTFPPVSSDSSITSGSSLRGRGFNPAKSNCAEAAGSSSRPAGTNSSLWLSSNQEPPMPSRTRSGCR